MKRDPLIILGLIGLTLLAFCRIGDCHFVNFDDFSYIVHNPHVTGGLSWANFVWAWHSFEQGNYIPLSWLSFQLDVTLFGTGPHGFHWVNLAFHSANAVLVYLVFRRATGDVWRSALLAAIFAVHPLRVESVAWTVERKDVLTGFFGLLAMLAWLEYTRQRTGPTGGPIKATWYIATLVLFAATLLAKQTLSTLPCVLLLMDFWPLGRWKKGPSALIAAQPPRHSLFLLILEKLPLVVMSAAILTITARAQGSSGAIVDLQADPLSQRLANVPMAYVRYLGKMVWFGDLAVFYPLHPWTVRWVAAACILLGAISLICILKYRSAPWLLVGWLWFIGVLVPMIGLVQFGHVTQAMADRFTYFSGLGVLVMVVWSVPNQSRHRAAFSIAAVTMVLGALSVFTIVQTGYWKDTVSLFQHNVNVEDSATAETNLADALSTQPNQLSNAIAHFRRAVAMDEHKARRHANLAVVLLRSGQASEALAEFDLARTCEPGNSEWRIDLAKAHRLYGLTLYKAGNQAEAINELRRAIELAPELKEVQSDVNLLGPGAGKN